MTHETFDEHQARLTREMREYEASLTRERVEELIQQNVHFVAGYWLGLHKARSNDIMTEGEFFGNIHRMHKFYVQEWINKSQEELSSDQEVDLENLLKLKETVITQNHAGQLIDEHGWAYGVLDWIHGGGRHYSDVANLALALDRVTYRGHVLMNTANAVNSFEGRWDYAQRIKDGVITILHQ